MKKILFVIDELNIGGAQKSLVNLLNEIDYENYNVDLILLRRNGVMEKQIPINVNMIELSNKERMIFMKAKYSIKNLAYNKNYKEALNRFKGILSYKLKFTKLNLTQILWKNMSKYISTLSNEYDVAIGYLEGLSSYYVIDKVISRKKILWMHTDYKETNYNREFDKKYFEQADKIIHVSNKSLSNFIEIFPKFKDKVKVVLNMLNKNDIIEKSKELTDEMDYDGIKIVTVGRLEKVKGYELAIGTLEKLINSGYDVKWYAIGMGNEFERLKNIVKSKKMEDKFIFLGVQTNPYKYVGKCNIYVQTSIAEGYCITLLEAKVLNKVIVTTNFTGASEQIKNRITGSIVESNIDSIYNGIKELIENKELCNKYKNNLSKEKIEINDIDKFYEIIV